MPGLSRCFAAHLGIRQFLSSTDEDSRAQPESAWSVATITFANCSDDLAVYTPLFGMFSHWQAGLIAITFNLLLFLYGLRSPGPSL